MCTYIILIIAARIIHDASARAVSDENINCIAVYQRRCVKAYMSHDIPSRARAIIAFLGVETGYGARIKALACTFIGVGGVRPRD